MLPMAKPGLISIGIFNVLGQWNQFVLPSVLLTTERQRVLTQGIADAAGQPTATRATGAPCSPP